MNRWHKTLFVFMIIVNTASIAEFVTTGEDGITPYWVDAIIVLLASGYLIFYNEDK